MGALRPQFRNLKGRNSPSWGDCSLSVDLTADEIPATGGHRRFVPRSKAFGLWTPPGDYSLLGKTDNFRLSLGDTGICRFLARRLKAANPDAKHPGKAGEESQGKSELSPTGFFQAFLGQNPPTFRIPSDRRASFGISEQVTSPGEGSRGIIPLVVVWRQSLQRTPCAGHACSVFRACAPRRFLL